MLEHIPGLPDLILFWMNDVSVIRVSRCGITRGTLSGKHVLTLIWMIMTGGSFKIVSNWAVLTTDPYGWQSLACKRRPSSARSSSSDLILKIRVGEAETIRLASEICKLIHLILHLRHQHSAEKPGNPRATCLIYGLLACFLHRTNGCLLNAGCVTAARTRPLVACSSLLVRLQLTLL